MLILLYRRTDGTFVANVNNLPYHVTLDDALFPQAQAIAIEMGDALPFEPGLAPSDPVMPAITARQLRLTLLGLGVTAATVEGALASIPDKQTREAGMIEWEYATVFPRDHPLIGMMGSALGMTEAQIDDAWQKAAFL